MSPPNKNDERIELRVRSIDAKVWRRAADAEGLSLSDWIRRACTRALSSDQALTIAVHDVADARGVSAEEVLDEAFDRIEAQRKAAKSTKRKGK